MSRWGHHNHGFYRDHKFGAIDGAVIGVILCAVISRKFGWHPTFTTIGICAAAGGVAGMMLRNYLDDAQKAPDTSEFFGTPEKPREQEKPLPQILPPDDKL